MRAVLLVILLGGASNAAQDISDNSEDTSYDDGSYFSHEDILAEHKNMLVDSMSHFTTNLFSNLLENKDLSGNVMFSPMSSHHALVVLMGGAEGKTKKQLKSGLGLSSEEDIQSLISILKHALGKTITREHLRVETANKAYLAKKPSNKFNKLIYALSGDKPSVIDFKNEPEDEVREIINQYVEAGTHGKIKNFITKGIIKRDTAFIIVNALYFKGSWKNTFDKRLTSKAPFYPTDGEQITVFMMKIRKPIKATFKIMKDFGARVLKLPYTGGRISMILILPEQRYQLATVTEKLKRFGVHKLIEEIEEVQQNNITTSVRVSLPKFTCKKTLRLNGPLKQLGMTDMFSKRANFRMLADKRDKIKLSQLLQKIQLSVYEEGSEAVSATVGIGDTFMSKKTTPVKFKCDEPFLFFLQDDQTKMILFAGKIKNPNLSN